MGLRAKHVANISAALAAALFTALISATNTNSSFDDGGASAEAGTVASEAPVSPVVLRNSPKNTHTRDEIDAQSGDMRVIEYWSEARMAAAIPVEMPDLGSIPDQAGWESGERDQIQGEGRKIAEPAEPTDAYRYDSAKTAPVTNFSKTNGKVFFRNAQNGKDYVCSRSALNSGFQRLVSTAGHCVHGGPGASWHQNWVFVPAYSEGPRPYGAFSAKTLRTFSDWIDYVPTDRGFNSDVAFVTTFSNVSGSQVVQAVGGHGLWNGGSKTFDVSVFGYPANLNNGQKMWACWGTSESRRLGLYEFSSISGCGFGGGASGGPWLYQYNNNSGLGYLRTVNSFGPKSSTAYIAGPYFDNRVVTLYNLANGDW